MMFMYASPSLRILRFMLVMLLIGGSMTLSWAKGRAAPSSSQKRQKTTNPASLVVPQEPISIDADHLRILESKHQAVFEGNVHAIQDDVHMRCSQLTVSYESTPDAPTSSSKKIHDEPGPSETSLVEGVTVTSLECNGPVTITSNDQVVTGKHASFDKGAQVIKVSGDAKLAQGPNILTGDRILYSLSDRVARVEGHVKALFTPKENESSKNPAGP